MGVNHVHYGLIMNIYLAAYGLIKEAAKDASDLTIYADSKLLKVACKDPFDFSSETEVQCKKS